MLQAINADLEGCGLLMRTGTIMDATLIPLVTQSVACALPCVDFTHFRRHKSTSNLKF